MKDNMTPSPPKCWICKDQAMVFYEKRINNISYDFAYRCTCKLGGISSDKIPQVPREFAEKVAQENYKSYLKRSN